MSGLATAWTVLCAEGPLALRDRTLDRLAEARRRRRYRSASPQGPCPPVPVLNLVGQQPVPWLGGVAIQLRRRLDAEAAARPTALLYPDRPATGAWRLETCSGGRRRALVLAGGRPSPVTVDDPAFAGLVARACELLAATVVHVEGLAGLPLGELLRLRQRGTALAVSLHDFSAFCPRPHLDERPGGGFCHYSRDSQRCARCLAADWDLPAGYQEERRSIAGALLAAADLLVFSSDFLRRAYSDLFPGLSPERHLVVAPQGPASPAAMAPSAVGGPRHVALVGGVKPHKGAETFAEVVRGAQSAGLALRFSAYGGGDRDLLARLRRLGVRVRGYYRAGALPRLLRRDRVDLALLLSRVPESYGLVLDECRAAGVPGLAFDRGALGERLRAGGGGLLVDPSAAAGGVLAALGELCAGRVATAPWQPESAPSPGAAALLAAYRERGWL